MLARLWLRLGAFVGKTLLWLLGLGLRAFAWLTFNRRELRCCAFGLHFFCLGTFSGCLLRFGRRSRNLNQVCCCCFVGFLTVCHR